MIATHSRQCHGCQTDARSFGRNAQVVRGVCVKLSVGVAQAWQPSSGCIGHNNSSRKRQEQMLKVAPGSRGPHWGWNRGCGRDVADRENGVSTRAPPGRQLSQRERPMICAALDVRACVIRARFPARPQQFICSSSTAASKLLQVVSQVSRLSELTRVTWSKAEHPGWQTSRRKQG